MRNTILLSVSQLQGHYNSAKDMIIERLNRDLKLNLDPIDYIFVAHQKGCLGRMWDKIFGVPKENTTQIQLLVVKHERSENIDNDVSAS